MNTRKYRIGRDLEGWYLAIPSPFLGGYSVMQGIPTFEKAVQLFEESRAWFWR